MVQLWPVPSGSTGTARLLAQCRQYLLLVPPLLVQQQAIVTILHAPLEEKFQQATTVAWYLQTAINVFGRMDVRPTVGIGTGIRSLSLHARLLLLVRRPHGRAGQKEFLQVARLATVQQLMQGLTNQQIGTRASPTATQHMVALVLGTPRVTTPAVSTKGWT